MAFESLQGGARPPSPRAVPSRRTTPRSPSCRPARRPRRRPSLVFPLWWNSSHHDIPASAQRVEPCSEHSAPRCVATCETDFFDLTMTTMKDCSLPRVNASSLSEKEKIQGTDYPKRTSETEKQQSFPPQVGRMAMCRSHR
jgi:hypothetical protein